MGKEEERGTVMTRVGGRGGGRGGGQPKQGIEGRTLVNRVRREAGRRASVVGSRVNVPRRVMVNAAKRVEWCGARRGCAWLCVCDAGTEAESKAS